MKIGLTIDFFDFRNDVRRVISELAKNYEVIIFTNESQKEKIITFELPNTSVRIIKEKRKNPLNYIIDKLYFYFKRIPSSEKNFYLMEYFKINLIKSKKIRSIAFFHLFLIKILPKFIEYDWYLRKIFFKKDTKIDDVDTIIFFTNILDDYFLARCIDEKKDIQVYVYSWDHPFKHTKFSKNVIYKVWNIGMKDDLRNIQKIPENKIIISGSSQLSFVKEVKSIVSTMNQSFDFKYVYFACSIGIEELVVKEVNLIKYLNKIIFTNFPDIKLVVRPYPNLKNWSLYDELKSSEIIIDYDDNKDIINANKMIKEKFEKIENSLLFIHLGTTLGLEAAFFNTNSYLIDFDEFDNSKLLTIKNFVHQAQNKKYLIETGQVLKNKEQFIQLLKKINQNEMTGPYNKSITRNFDLLSFTKIANNLISRKKLAHYTN